MTEAQLIERARGGDGAALRELYERYAPRVLSVVRRIAADEDLARDCAQEAWMRAIRALRSFRGDALFSTWLHRVAVNTALQACRDARRRGEVERPLPESLVGPVKPHDVLLERRLEEALERVPDGMREVLVLHDVEGYTHQEIGETLEVSVGTSKSQLFKARARMRELLSGSLDPTGSGPRAIGQHEGAKA